MAARLGKEDVIKLLLNAGAAIEATNQVTLPRYQYVVLYMHVNTRDG